MIEQRRKEIWIEQGNNPDRYSHSVGQAMSEYAKEYLSSLQSKGKTKEEVKLKEVLRDAFGYYSQIGETDMSQKDVDDDFEEWYKEAMEEYAQSHANKGGWVSVEDHEKEIQKLARYAYPGFTEEGINNYLKQYKESQQS